MPIQKNSIFCRKISSILFHLFRNFTTVQVFLPYQFEILIHFDVLLFVLLFVLYTLVLFKVGIVDKNRFAHPQASCVVVPISNG